MILDQLLHSPAGYSVTFFKKIIQDFFSSGQDGDNYLDLSSRQKKKKKDTEEDCPRDMGKIRRAYSLVRVSSLQCREGELKILLAYLDWVSQEFRRARQLEFIGQYRKKTAAQRTHLNIQKTDQHMNIRKCPNENFYQPSYEPNWWYMPESKISNALEQGSPTVLAVGTGAPIVVAASPRKTHGPLEISEL